MDLKKLQDPLPIESIDFRVQSINKGGYATILAYKDARVDMQRLDDVVGALNWKREHKNENRNCVVSIFNEETLNWVSKEDTGTESNTEKEKGLASDSFKRACFNWGIGRELYEYPIIQIKLNANEFKVEQFNGKEVVKPTFDFKLKDWKWFSEFDENNKLTYLSCKDEKGVERFLYVNKKSSNNTPVNPPQQPKQPEHPKTPEKPLFTKDKFVGAHQNNATIDIIKTKYAITPEMETAYLAYVKAEQEKLTQK